MENELPISKHDVILLKLDLEILENYKDEVIRTQKYAEAAEIRDKQKTILERMCKAEKSLRDLLSTIERIPKNYILLQKIHDVLLELQLSDKQFEEDFKKEMTNRYYELEQQVKNLQMINEFTKAKEVFSEKVEFGKFIGVIPK